MNETKDEHWSTASTDVVFLGAGFSRCVSADRSPLMNDFFDELDDRKYWSLWKFLTECYAEPRTANVEEALLKLDQLCLAPLKGKDAFFDQCRKRRTEVRDELDQYMLERLTDYPIARDNWAANMLFSASDTTTVITTNYDNIAERILSCRPTVQHSIPETNCHHCKMRLILEDECETCGGVEDNGKLWQGSVLKLHGSISWKMCSNPECDSTQCLVADSECQSMHDAVCDSCGKECSPVLVHPSMTKTFDRFRGLSRMWGGAYDALSNCRSVMFFGFSFPTSDTVISEMIRSTMGRSSGELRVYVIDIAPDAPLKRLKELLANRRDKVSYCDGVVPADQVKPEWFQYV